MLNPAPAIPDTTKDFVQRVVGISLSVQLIGKSPKAANRALQRWEDLAESLLDGASRRAGIFPITGGAPYGERAEDREAVLAAGLLLQAVADQRFKRRAGV